MHANTGRSPGGGIEGFDNKPDKPKTKDPPVPLYTVPLLEVLQRFRAPLIIDYLSLDIEGAEFFVMKDFPFKSSSVSMSTLSRREIITAPKRTRT